MGVGYRQFQALPDAQDERRFEAIGRDQGADRNAMPPGRGIEVLACLNDGAAGRRGLARRPRAARTLVDNGRRNRARAGRQRTNHQRRGDACFPPSRSHNRQFRTFAGGNRSREFPFHTKFGETEKIRNNIDKVFECRAKSER